MPAEPQLNQIIIIDLKKSNKWDWFKRSRPFLITKVEKLKEADKELFLLLLLSITSQEDEGEEKTTNEKKEEKKLLLSQYQIHRFPNCLEINPSFVKIKRPFGLKIIPKRLVGCLCKKHPNGCLDKKEYDFFVEKHERYQNNKMNELLLLPPFRVEILE